MLMIPAVILAIESDNDRIFMIELYQQHHSLMLKTAWGFTRNKADVEDIVSDSCAALIEKIDTLRGLECHALRSYIVSTVRNTAIDFCRKQQRENARFLHVEDEAAIQVADQESIEQKILLRDELESLERILLQLPERERDVLRLKYQQGFKDGEVAALVGLAESSVRKYIERARKHIKAVMYEGAML